MSQLAELRRKSLTSADMDLQSLAEICNDLQSILNQAFNVPDDTLQNLSFWPDFMEVCRYVEIGCTVVNWSVTSGRHLADAERLESVLSSLEIIKACVPPALRTRSSTTFNGQYPHLPDHNIAAPSTPSLSSNPPSFSVPRVDKAEDMVRICRQLINQWASGEGENHRRPKNMTDAELLESGSANLLFVEKWLIEHYRPMLCHVAAREGVCALLDWLQDTYFDAVTDAALRQRRREMNHTITSLKESLLAQS
eukprot:CAMPEP_0196659260 /NCGR_PEP_ID=MMETSP1086-20130531/33986_1 /TAXON_ID=77921 /ORGANISM="Cyanoptyche  gloeocystis , Strain SAG4.97" /LENGTH=251 /DNA_ID=CAMNT_0041993151 /DNA_START=130 /DNA_END=885 /DNA_ORIENTATION=+